MIKSKKEYKYYLECDRKALGREKRIPAINDYIWRFQRLMRKREYYTNCKGKIYIIHKIYLWYKYNRLSLLLGFEIPINSIGPGLSIAHRGSIIINSKVKIGSNCRIHSGVNIGTSAGSSDKVPNIKNNVYIGPGAKLYGDIIIGNNVAIGANSVVNKSFESNVTIAGAPAKIINYEGSIGKLKVIAEELVL